MLLVVLLLWALLAAPAGAAEPGALTLQQAIAAALAHNPQLRVAQAQEREAYWGWKLAASTPSTTVTLNHTFGTNNIVPNNGQVNDYNVAVAEEFAPFGFTGWSGRAGEAAWHAAHTNTLQIQTSVLQSVRDAFYGVLVAQEQQQIAHDNLDLANQIYHVAERRYAEGAGPKMDLVNAQIQQSTAEQGLIQQEAALKVAQSALAPLLGVPASPPPRVQGRLEVPRLVLHLDALQKLAAQFNPQLEEARLLIQQNVAQVRADLAQRNVSPGILYNYDLTTPDLYMVLLTFEVPIDWGVIRNAVHQQENVVHEKQAASDEAIVSVSSALKTAFDNYDAAIRNGSVYVDKVLKPSQDLVRMTQLGYQEGATPYVQVLLAEQNLRTARNQYLTLLLSGHQALDALEAATGTTLEGDDR
ncbi:MAG: TolC family protein [Candidatus Xenobia bacterium]